VSGTIGLGALPETIAYPANDNEANGVPPKLAISVNVCCLNPQLAFWLSSIVNQPRGNCESKSATASVIVCKKLDCWVLESAELRLSTIEFWNCAAIKSTEARFEFSTIVKKITEIMVTASSAVRFSVIAALN